MCHECARIGWNHVGLGGACLKMIGFRGKGKREAMAHLLEIETFPIVLNARGEWSHGGKPLHPRVEKLFRERKIGKLEKSGVTFLDRERVHIRAKGNRGAFAKNDVGGNAGSSNTGFRVKAKFT